MSLPTPKLDDIAFEDIRKAAISKIPDLCKTWTDFNPSDPGITLIELMAWMTELMLYRLNRVPEKNFIKFLELMGVKLASPRPARCWVLFELVKGAKEEALPVIEAGTLISTKPGGEEPIPFETTETLNLTTASIKTLCSRVGDRVTDHTRALQALQDGRGQEMIFNGETRVCHYLYLGDARLGDLPKDSNIVLSVEVAKQVETSLHIQWEAWDGMAWAPLCLAGGTEEPFEGLRSSGEIPFRRTFKLEEATVNGVNSVWLRAQLMSADGDAFPTLTSLKVAVSVAPEYGILPGAVFQRRIVEEGPEIPLQPIEPNREFEPFGEAPEPGNALYIISPLFGRQGATCQVRFMGPRKQASRGDKQEVSWEYWCTEKGWWPLGTEQDLQDGTNALTGAGTVSFAVPEDITQPLLQGQSEYAIRVRLTTTGGTEAQASQPAFSAIQISFTEPASDFEVYVREDYGISEKIEMAPGSPNMPFLALKDEGSTFCLTLDSRPANRDLRIYFQLDEQAVTLPPGVEWEYWTNSDADNEGKGKWCELPVRKDTTRGLSTSGALDFLAPADWERGSPEQGVDGYWMRARRVVAELPKASVLKGLYLNATEVVQATANKEKVLGSSNGEPFQSFSFEADAGPVLPGISILVKELEKPTSEDLERLRDKLSTEVKVAGEAAGKPAAVSRWYEVENFFASGPDDCHYMFDQRRGTITFGDGRHGRIPPIGRDNVLAERYYVGGGARGNVGQGTITVLEVAKEFVKSVSNIAPAQGGEDAETIEAAKLRGPWALRHRYRAVTREDFERLAKEASTEVALAKCFTPEEAASQGEEVLVVIVPKVEEIGARPRPSSRLIQTVRNYLNERRLVTTELGVVGPEYDDLVIELDVALATRHSGRFSQIRATIASELERFLDALSGGPEGDGWPMGRTVHISELYYLLERVDGVDYVDRLRMREYCADQNEWKEKIRIGTRSFPYVRQIEVRQV